MPNGDFEDLLDVVPPIRPDDGRRELPGSGHSAEVAAVDAEDVRHLPGPDEVRVNKGGAVNRLGNG